MYQLNNLFYGELDLSGGDITSGASTITLSSGDVANLEITPTATDPALFTIWDKAYETAAAARRDSGKVELIEVTGKDEANDTLTAGTRGFSNTTAQSYSSTDNTTYGIVQVSADELFDSLLIAGASNKIQDRSGTTLDTINAATMLQIAGTDVVDSGSWTLEIADENTGGNTASFSGGAQYVQFASNIMYISFRATSIDTTGMTGTNALTFRNLPAAAAGVSTDGYVFSDIPILGDFTFSGYVTARLPGGGTTFNLNQITSGASAGSILVNDLASGSARIEFSVFYFI